MADKFDRFNLLIKRALSGAQTESGKNLLKSVQDASKETSKKGDPKAKPDSTTTGVLTENKPYSTGEKIASIISRALSPANRDNTIGKVSAAVAYLNMMAKKAAQPQQSANYYLPPVNSGRVFAPGKEEEYGVRALADVNKNIPVGTGKAPSAIKGNVPKRSPVQWTPELNALVKQRTGLQRGTQEWAQIQNRINTLMGDPTRHRGLPSGPAMAAATPAPAKPAIVPNMSPAGKGAGEFLFMGKNQTPGTKSYNLDAMFGQGFSKAGVPDTAETRNRALTDAGMQPAAPAPTKTTVGIAPVSTGGGLAAEMAKVPTKNPGLAASVAQARRLRKMENAQSYSLPNLEYGPSMLAGKPKTPKKSFGEKEATEMGYVGNDVNVGDHYASLANALALEILGLNKTAGREQIARNLIRNGFNPFQGRLAAIKGLPYRNADEIFTRDFSTIAQEPRTAEFLLAKKYPHLLKRNPWVIPGALTAGAGAYGLLGR